VKTDGTGATSYTWDYENRLASVILPGSGGTVSFKYNPFGRRIYKSSGSGTSVYAYDGDNLIEETNPSGAVVARYSQTQNIDEPLAMLRGGTTSYYQADGLGSVTSLTSTAGAVAQNYTYDSFGNIVATAGSLTNSFRYTGREFDPETSLYYYRARHYDLTARRFLSEDPIRFRGGTNFYEYVRNNPVRFTDPTGLSGCESKFHQFACHPLTQLWVLSSAGLGLAGVSSVGGSAVGGGLLTLGGEVGGIAVVSASAAPAVAVGLVVVGIAWAFYCW